MLLAEELLERSQTALNAGRIAESTRLARRAMDRSTCVDTTAGCLLRLALLEAERGGLAQGLELCDLALRVPPESPEVVGTIHAQVGALHMRAGDSVEALAALSLAEPLLPEGSVTLAGLYLNRGYVYLQRQEATLACEAFAKARDLSQDPTLSAKAEHNLGYAEFMRGNLVDALRLMERADVLLDPLSPFMRAVNESDRAEALSACGMPGEAAAALERAARAFAVRKLRQSQAEAELARARILLQRDPVRAIQLARRAGRRFRLRGSEDWALRAEVVAVGGEVALKRRNSHQSASDLYGQLMARRLRADAKTTALYAATAELEAGEVGDARRWVSRARVGDTDPLETRLLDQLVRARLAAARGQFAWAFNHLRAGLDDLHEWLSAFGSLDLQSSLVGRGRRLAAFGLEIAVADGRPEVVFEWFERARVLVARVTPVRAALDEDAAADLAHLRELQESGAEAEDLKASIRQRAWYAPSMGRSAQPAALPEVQGALGGDALLALILTKGHLTALVVTSEDAHVVSLGPSDGVLALLPTLAADLEMGAAELPPPIAAAVRSSLEDRLATLSATLLDPVADLLGSGRVAIVPAGALAGVPWSLLPGLRGRPLTVARSATHWLASASIAPRLGTAGFVTGPGVPRAAEEVRRSASGWQDATPRIAIDGVAAEVSEIAGSVDVLHVAAHGRHSAENPLFSGIELTGGPWFGYDIDQLPQVPSVVLLSSCELGRSTIRGAEELVGMTTAWLHAGTRCVIASPAAVNDDLAAELLPVVHRGLATGEPPADALANAMVEVDGLAAFACYGSGW